MPRNASSRGTVAPYRAPSRTACVSWSCWFQARPALTMPSIKTISNGKHERELDQRGPAIGIAAPSGRVGGGAVTAGPGRSSVTAVPVVAKKPSSSPCRFHRHLVSLPNGSLSFSDRLTALCRYVPDKKWALRPTGGRRPLDGH